MLKIDNVVKGDNYYTLNIVDGSDTFGMIFTMVPERPVTVEFMIVNPDNESECTSIIPDTYPEKYQEMRDKYLDIVLEYLKTMQ